MQLQHHLPTFTFTFVPCACLHLPSPSCHHLYLCMAGSTHLLHIHTTTTTSHTLPVSGWLIYMLTSQSRDAVVHYSHLHCLLCQHTHILYCCTLPAFYTPAAFALPRHMLYRMDKRAHAFAHLRHFCALLRTRAHAMPFYLPVPLPAQPSHAARSPHTPTFYTHTHTFCCKHLLLHFLPPFPTHTFLPSACPHTFFACPSFYLCLLPCLFTCTPYPTYLYHHLLPPPPSFTPLPLPPPPACSLAPPTISSALPFVPTHTPHTLPPSLLLPSLPYLLLPYLQKPYLGWVGWTGLFIPYIPTTACPTHPGM